MATLDLSTVQLHADNGALVEPVKVGAAVSRGDPLYNAGGVWYPADYDSQAAALATRLALNSAPASGYVPAVQLGTSLAIAVDATLSKATYYVGNAGAVVEFSDIAVGKWVRHLFDVRQSGTKLVGNNETFASAKTA